MPASVGIHLVFFAVWSFYLGAEGGVAFFLMVTAVGAFLYLMLFRRRNWARLALGIVTFPYGLILLLSPEARRFTGGIRPSATSVFDLRGTERSND